MFKKFILLFVVSFSFIIAQQADLLIYSYNRPMQLYALLESIEKYVTGIGDIAVIYRTGSKFEKAYTEVADAFCFVPFIKQGKNPFKDFKPLTMEFLQSSENKYILFAVDDIIVKDFINLSECIDLLEKTKTYAFYLRLGKNINYCYTEKKPQLPPRSLKEVEPNVFQWQFKNALYEWRYPHSLDMTLFPKSLVIKDFSELSFANPNRLEAVWAGRKGRKRFDQYGLCFKTSKIINIPLNMVQQVFTNNNCMHAMNPSKLLRLFEQGLKIDIKPLDKINNNSPHMEYLPTFIKR